jgi:multidrug resistance efflux pump
MKNSKGLPPIPTPLSVVWREFRVQVIPFVMFAAVVVAAVYLWRTLPMAGSIRGVGEGARSVVTSPRVGVLQSVEVQPFQWVEAGDPLLTILPYDPAAQLDLLRSEAQLMRLRFEPSMADQNAINYERVRVDLLALKLQFAEARVNLAHAENMVATNASMVKERLISQEVYELSLRDRDLYRAQTNEIGIAIHEVETRFNQLKALGEPEFPGTNQLAASLLARLDERIAGIETNYGPVTLVAPISGRVHMITRQRSEFVLEGEPLVMIASPRSERIIAYLRQPFSFEPQPGMQMDVQLQNKQRQKFATQIVQVGAQMEAITNGLAFLQQGALVDMGLPIVLSVPQGVQLRPGEIVTISPRSGPMNILGRSQADATDRSEPLVQLRP